ncbi:hypothetical protein [Polynucleobacter sp. UK-Mo-2m-Kol15]|uniref:hypothetical protein n=1 Tax=Polynucleobacter sp. UK-Mo-2m-Kol15 TaxID=2576916 RepID=UPI001C0B332E|nr:hypothetical protein [Polynucleobacter sp. UK-Mo-2m-Kol15]MBU3576182.1 hypothetical protein [Polynucleobacter sp. UK-Mo-2m-Kol15]
MKPSRCLSHLLGAIQGFRKEKAPQEARLSKAGGSGEIRTRDQRIKRSHVPSKTYIAYGFERPKNERAIDCAIAFLVHSAKSRYYIKSRVIVDQPQ